MICAEIKPHVYYDSEAVARLLELSKHKLKRETTEGRIRSVERAGKLFYRGAWLIEWLEGGSGDQSDDAGGDLIGVPADA